MSDGSLLIGVFLATLMGCAAAPGGGGPPAQTRTYYIAADSVEWNYAPGSDTNLITGAPYDSVARFYALSGPTRIGHVLSKAVYREYTDSTFTQLKPREARWEHLGILGPLIRGGGGRYDQGGLPE